jgi:hypothetical protein
LDVKGLLQLLSSKKRMNVVILSKFVLMMFIIKEYFARIRAVRSKILFDAEFSVEVGKLKFIN